MNITSGYSSGHHIFPSNWIDIEDKVIFTHSFTLLIPIFILNYFNKYNNFAYLIYLVSYQLAFSGITHKYAHERNHNRYVPKFIKLLQKLKLSLSFKNHSIHHRDLNKNFSLLNGLTDNYLNKFINFLDIITKKKHIEESIYITEKYKKIYGDKILMKFTGDIDGELKFKMKNNKFSVRYD